MATKPMTKATLLASLLILVAAVAGCTPKDEAAENYTGPGPSKAGAPGSSMQMGGGKDKAGAEGAKPVAPVATMLSSPGIFSSAIPALG